MECCTSGGATQSATSIATVCLYCTEGGFHWFWSFLTVTVWFWKGTVGAVFVRVTDEILKEAGLNESTGDFSLIGV